MRNPITFSTYKAAADRIRRGRPHELDLAICETHDAATAPGPIVRSVLDLPMAAGMWRADARDLSR